MKYDTKHMWILGAIVLAIVIAMVIGFQTWCHATTMWKISQLSHEFFKWKRHEKQFFDELKRRNDPEKHQKSKSSTNTKPLVFDVPVVPNKINGIFQESNGALNLTALSNLVRKLKFKNIDQS